MDALALRSYFYLQIPLLRRLPVIPTPKSSIQATSQVEILSLNLRKAARKSLEAMSIRIRRLMTLTLMIIQLVKPAILASPIALTLLVNHQSSITYGLHDIKY